MEGQGFIFIITFFFFLNDKSFFIIAFVGGMVWLCIHCVWHPLTSSLPVCRVRWVSLIRAAAERRADPGAAGLQGCQLSGHTFWSHCYSDWFSQWQFCCSLIRGRLYRRRYQLVFFKTSAKDIKNTPSILVVQISVIHQLKLWSVYFFCVHSRIQQNFVVLEKKKKTNRMRSLSSPSPWAAFQNTSLKWTVTQRKLNTRTWELYL